MAVRSLHSPPCNTGGGPPSQSRRQCCDRLRTQLNWQRVWHGRAVAAAMAVSSNVSQQPSVILISQVPVPRQSRRSLGALVKSRRPGPAEEGWAEEQQRGSNNQQQRSPLSASFPRRALNKRTRSPARDFLGPRFHVVRGETTYIRISTELPYCFPARVRKHIDSRILHHLLAGRQIRRAL